MGKKLIIHCNNYRNLFTFCTNRNMNKNSYILFYHLRWIFFLDKLKLSTYLPLIFKRNKIKERRQYQSWFVYWKLRIIIQGLNLKSCFVSNFIKLANSSNSDIDEFKFNAWISGNNFWNMSNKNIKACSTNNHFVCILFIRMKQNLSPYPPLAMKRTKRQKQNTPDQTRPDQTRKDQTRPDQARPEHIVPVPGDLRKPKSTRIESTFHARIPFYK